MRSILITLGLAATAIRTSPQQPPETFRTGVDVVQVDVSVLDKHRVPVQGLTADDFTVLEDGKPRPIVAFAPVTLPAAPKSAPSAAWLRDVPPDVVTNDVPREGRLVVIMFDWSIRFLDQQLARRIATAAVDQLAPGDLAAVVFTSAFANGGAPQNFTADRARLLAAINQPFALALQNPSVGPSHDPRNGNGVMLDDPEAYESGDCLCRVCVADAITHVADSLRDVPERRKVLLFIGTYFRSYEALDGPVSRPRGGPPASVTGTIRPTAQQTNCSAYLKDARDKMQRATSLANLTIHTLDPVGLETRENSPMGGSVVGMLERQSDLTVPADLTGGRTIINTGTPEAAIPGLFAESGSYYVLAFAPADRKRNAKLHSIDVRVNRPGVTVRTRSGYYAGETRPPGRSPLTVSSDAADALRGVLPRADVPLDIAVTALAAEGDPRAVLAVVLGVRQPSSADPSVKNAPVKVLVAAFDRNGRSVQSEEQTVAVTWQPDATGVMPYAILSRLPVKPGRYEVRAALDAGSNHRGSVYTFVDVPDFTKRELSLSSIVLAAVPPVLTAPKDAFTKLLPILPTARRAFVPTDRVTGLVRVYQGGGQPARSASMTASVTDAHGRVVATQTGMLEANAFIDTHEADSRFDIPFAQLEPGDYLLNVDGVSGPNTARRSVRFSVLPRLPDGPRPPDAPY